MERDPEVMAATKALLEELGFSVVVATTLLGARAACQAWCFDLMIIGSSIPRSTAAALVRLVAKSGGPPSLRLREDTDGHRSDLLSIFRGALPLQ